MPFQKKVTGLLKLPVGDDFAPLKAAHDRFNYAVSQPVLDFGPVKLHCRQGKRSRSAPSDPEEIARARNPLNFIPTRWRKRWRRRRGWKGIGGRIGDLGDFLGDLAGVDAPHACEVLFI